VGVEPRELIRTAQLARLNLTDEECARLAADLNGILAQVETLLAIEVDLDAAPPLGSLAVEADRADEPASDPLEHPLSEFAPEFRSGFFTVPRVLAP
jgi:aspartyl/glutamyl-tRNA(Asn/Gln) amidotransferase C subunit